MMAVIITPTYEKKGAGFSFFFACLPVNLYRTYPSTFECCKKFSKIIRSTIYYYVATGEQQDTGQDQSPTPLPSSGTLE